MSYLGIAAAILLRARKDYLDTQKELRKLSFQYKSHYKRCRNLTRKLREIRLWCCGVWFKFLCKCLGISEVNARQKICQPS